jgi:hypothetical protein
MKPKHSHFINKPAFINIIPLPAGNYSLRTRWDSRLNQLATGSALDIRGMPFQHDN